MKGAAGRRARVPAATYRLQLNAGFPLRAAADLVPYLDALGVSDLYASPFLRARAGSTHGYDVTDHGRLDPALGTEDDLARLCAALRERGMGLLADVVPNHMGIDDPSNRWWWDVLEKGRDSPFARCFDVDWDPPDPALRGKILLPVLGASLEEALARGEIRLVREEDRLLLRYFDHRFPLAPESAKEAGAALREASGDPARLKRILSVQHYVLAHWREGLARINYRRFFDISHLVGLRVEDPEVFEAVHARLFRWLAAGLVTGLRIDHPDGLTDPTAYFRRLQAGCALSPGSPAPEARDSPAGGVPPAGGEERACYVVAEKILTGDERLRDDWAVHGTTGYDFLNDLNALFVDPAGAAAMRQAYARFTGRDRDLEEVIHESKREVLETRFTAELDALVRRLAALPGAHGAEGVVPAATLRDALSAVIVSFPVYRTYLAPGDRDYAEPEGRRVRRALGAARDGRPDLPAAAFDAVARALGVEVGGEAPIRDTAARLAFVQRFQQLTAPVMAKGVEDTAFYRDVAMLSLNEVGGDPARGGIGPDEFHARNARRHRDWPEGLLATSTHDTKRGEDLRARLNVLSEIPADWEAAVLRWREMNAPLRRAAGGEIVPDPGEEYLLYQTVLGAWPLAAPEGETLERFAGRIREYMRKALREAKIHTRWIDPREAYEAAVDGFVRDLLQGDTGRPFREDLARFAARVAWPGALNGLSQLLLKIASPGVPDFYQGTEFWDLRLVDPDNRRPVDFASRAAALVALERGGDGSGACVGALIESWRDGGIKLHVTRAALRDRRARASLYTRGEYLPLAPRGALAASLCAFARRTGDTWRLAVAGRLLTRVARSGGGFTGDAWADTGVELPAAAPRGWFDVLTGAAVDAENRAGASILPLRRVFRRLPVALLAPRSA